MNFKYERILSMAPNTVDMETLKFLTNEMRYFLRTNFRQAVKFEVLCFSTFKVTRVQSLNTCLKFSFWSELAMQ